MKKTLRTLAFSASLLVAANASAQTPVGTLIQDFTLTDILGATHNLYSYLDAGKTVVIDVSATWCGPCWAYHGTGALDAFNLAHGPSSGPNDAVVLFVEGDPSTTTPCLYGPSTPGCTGGSQGDWVTGESYPIIDLATSASFTSSGLTIPYYPAMYVICPNRTVIQSGVAGSIGTLSLLNSYMGTCDIATSGLNAALNSYTGATEFCGSSNVKVMLQNMGTTTLTSCTITATVGATTLGPINWTGSLSTYDFEEVDLGPVTLTGAATANVTITTSDALSSDNSVSAALAYNFAPSANIIVAMVTDRYGSETTWTLKNSGGTTVSSGGPYGPDLTASGTTTQTPVNLVLPSDCYTLKVNDAYGDGMCCSYGAGSYSIKYGTTTVLTGGAFGTTESRKFANNATDIEDITVFSGVNVFPNPVNGMATVNVDLVENNDILVTITNNVGQVLANVKKYNAPAGSNRMDLDFSTFANGVYYVNVTAGSQTTVAKVIK